MQAAFVEMPEHEFKGIKRHFWPRTVDFTGVLREPPSSFSSSKNTSTWIELNSEKIKTILSGIDRLSNIIAALDDDPVRKIEVQKTLNKLHNRYQALFKDKNNLK